MMTFLSSRRAVAVAALVLLVCLLPATAVAAPLDVQRDRTDNTFSFTYDASEGEITSATSSVRFDRKDPVSFIVNVRTNPSSNEVGERLKARLSLTLNKDRVVRYDGTFRVEITDVREMAVYRGEIDRRIVLRPRPRHRRGAMSFVFDLQSGSYQARGYFESRDT